ncbi:hypothetical protein ENH_00024330 [Eimeria necatrix]|uniref:Uncharacterized protein n=1 Tax=Eimeria necatrix TaxID=51315 RepID=U6MES2_9EIME|nr:hypothetical protein ENH_00024330 [Eimeria necatrix]CDJ62742.1 hypothetical protein ENH_00024330 [Eimeria necatrix]
MGPSSSCSSSSSSSSRRRSRRSSRPLRGRRAAPARLFAGRSAGRLSAVEVNRRLGLRALPAAAAAAAAAAAECGDFGEVLRPAATAAEAAAAEQQLRRRRNRLDRQIGKLLQCAQQEEAAQQQQQQQQPQQQQQQRVKAQLATMLGTRKALAHALSLKSKLAAADKVLNLKRTAGFLTALQRESLSPRALQQLQQELQQQVSLSPS